MKGNLGLFSLLNFKLFSKDKKKKPKQEKPKNLNPGSSAIDQLFFKDHSSILAPTHRASHVAFGYQVTMVLGEATE